jgi:hypothetical protein
MLVFCILLHALFLSSTEGCNWSLKPIRREWGERHPVQKAGAVRQTLKRTADGRGRDKKDQSVQRSEQESSWDSEQDA